MYAALAVVGLVLLLIWGLPALLTEHPHIDAAADRHKAISDTRTGLIAVVVAAGAGGGLAYTARTYRLSREGHITDRYSKAIEQLGHDKIEIRLGGIYALERLMRDSPPDQPTIMEVLAAYVRKHSPKVLVPADVGSHPDEADATLPSESARQYPPQDVHAVLTVLARRHAVAREHPIDLRVADLSWANLRVAHLSWADLSGTNLTRANLAWADLKGADLTRANLAWADLIGANLFGADLTGADLTDANLIDANLTDATLFGANLTDARFTGANLTDARFTRANLTRARLSKADMQNVTGLTQEQIDMAVLDQETLLPPGLVRPTAPRSL